MSSIQRSASSISTNSKRSFNSQKGKLSASVKSERSLCSSVKNPFVSLYKTTCTKWKTRQMPCIKVNDKTNSIEVIGDRMKVDDWQATMEALSSDVNTHHLCIKNKRYIEHLAKSYDTFSGVMNVPKNIPASGTLYVVRLIASSIKELLINSQTLICLELINVLFDEQSLETLISGVKANQTLQNISLAYCRIGDVACESLCQIIRDKPNIRLIDLTGCALTQISLEKGLVNLIKKQQVKRHEECWVHSLRSRTADPDIMHGLRRLTLNDNPRLGDEGLAALLESLKDDLYLKAVDLQNCGLTNRGAELALSTLMINDTLVVLDIRKNTLVTNIMLESIMFRLLKNNQNKTETKIWRWIKLGQESFPEQSLCSLA